MKASLEELSKKWSIPRPIHDLQIGIRTDVVEKEVKFGRTTFHLPYLSQENSYVLWKCLWPDCQNCCNRQLRLSLTKDDIVMLTKKLGYRNQSHFIREETLISTVQQVRKSGNTLITLTNIALKRRSNETEKDGTSAIPCRFLNEKGCGIHPDKPGVCWIYPFNPSVEMDANQRMNVHARFQFTGDCPGFYLDNSIDSMVPTLENYSAKLFDYCMSFNRTLRDAYGSSSKVVS